MSVDNKSKLLKYIVLTQMKGLGTVTQNALLDFCGDIDHCFESDYDDLFCREGIKLIGEKRMHSFYCQKDEKELWIRAAEILQLSESLEIEVIVRENADFPDRFNNIKGIPAVLYARGKLRINEFRDSTGIVGARRCTLKGKKRAIDIATEAVGNGIAVISGMAKGIDSYAHTAALKSQGYTIAVLGSGPDICYPEEHYRLYQEIARKGCILSEYPPGTLPWKYNFPKRNRLIAALSDKLFVIDAGRNSGTISTVEECKKYGRKVIMYGGNEQQPSIVI